MFVEHHTSNLWQSEVEKKDLFGNLFWFISFCFWVVHHFASNFQRSKSFQRSRLRNQEMTADGDHASRSSLNMSAVAWKKNMGPFLRCQKSVKQNNWMSNIIKKQVPKTTKRQLDVWIVSKNGKRFVIFFIDHVWFVMTFRWNFTNCFGALGGADTKNLHSHWAREMGTKWCDHQILIGG